jgi:hypothetical protein
MPSTDFTPTVADVGALLRARTKTASGSEAGTFTTETRPTADQVTALISTAAQDLVEVTGADIPESVWGSAKTAVIYRTAMLIELSYFPEQVATDRSAYPNYEKLWSEKLITLGEAVLQAGGGDLPGAVDDALLPSYGGFPNTGIGMEFDW